jgi:hypothetical protein
MKRFPTDAELIWATVLCCLAVIAGLVLMWGLG